MVTAVDDRNTAIEALTLGAYGYVTKPFNKNEILINVANALERRRLTLLSLEYERSLEEKVRERTQEVREREQAIVLHLISASGYRDDETGAHIRRIGLYSAVLAKHLLWNEEAVQAMRLAAPMHDVGKIGVPDGILLKPGSLTAEEFEVMKTHTIIGACILDNAGVPLLELARDIALSHHEKWDGSGYPQGLVGEAIPEAGRVVAVMDVYDALVHARVYRPALPEEEVLSMMTDGKGSHFDPRIFEAFLHLLPEMRRIRNQVKEEPGAYARMLKQEALNLAHGCQVREAITSRRLSRTGDRTATGICSPPPTTAV
jgi:putative two-component system response regulator